MSAKIKLNAASGGGSFSLQAPSSSANNRVFTLPDVGDTTLSTVDGTTMADMWRLNTNHTVATSSSAISSNWERVDSNSFAQIGTGMTESSGYFSFPQTGIYLIEFSAFFNNASNNERFVANQIYTTTNNSSYSETSYGVAGMGEGSHRNNLIIKCIFDVTNISTHKFVIYEYSYDGNTTMYGGSTVNYTNLTILRLGDT